MDSPAVLPPARPTSSAICSPRAALRWTSPISPKAASTELTITSQLNVVFRASRGKPVVLIGSSLGGYLAALYAARRAEVEKVVLLAPAFSFASHWGETMGEEKLDEWRRKPAVCPMFHYGDNAMRDLGWQFIRDARQYRKRLRSASPASSSTAR